MQIAEITRTWVLEDREYESKLSALEKRITKREAQVERLQNRKTKLKRPSFWIDSMIKPIAEILIKHFPDRTYEILGPFGICAETAIHFYKNGADDKWDNCLSITFRPMNLEEGQLGIIDYNTNTGEFQENTIGEVNGMNHPTIEIPENVEVEWLLPYIL